VVAFALGTAIGLRRRYDPNAQCALKSMRCGINELLITDGYTRPLRFLHGANWMPWQRVFRDRPFSQDPKEQRLARLQRRFRAITRPLERRDRRRRWVRAATEVVHPLAVTIAVTGAILTWWLTTLPPSWSWKERLLHLAAAPSCAAARAAHLAPAMRGEPGYFVRHDADDDGIACEPMPESAKRSHRPMLNWPRLHQ
jgi:hypothetical protein